MTSPQRDARLHKMSAGLSPVRAPNVPQWRYDPGMDEHFFAESSAWMTQAGLAGTPENEIFSVFCDRCRAAGIPVGRALHLSTRSIRSTRAGCSAGATVRTNPA